MRHTVPAACQFCRSKRTKCNGEQPCAACAKRGLECVYVTKLEDNETRQQAHKRKFEELSQAHQDLRRIYEILADRSNEHRALDVFRRIRNGQTPDTILRELRQIELQRPLSVSREQQLRQNFLTLVTQSTASLEEVKSVTAWALGPQSPFTLPTRTDCKALLDSTVSLGDIIEILQAINPHVQGDPYFNRLRGPTRSLSCPKDHDSEAQYWVPARPWTDLMDSDAVSQLVSVFLSLSNTSWRLVEQQAFLRDMRSGHVSAQYCSPLLVNAILSLASQYSELDVAFTEPGNLATRGERFHREAVRLWNIEEGKGSITNMQALNILHLDAALRGKEALAGTLLASAISLRHSFLDATDENSPAGIESIRVKRILTATTICMELIFHFTLLARSHSFTYASYDALNLDEVLPDTVVYWTAGDFRREPIPYHLNLQLRYRCRLATVLKDVCQVLLSHISQPSHEEFIRQTGDLATRLRQWHIDLPQSLHYDKVISWGLYELHAEYLCIIMTLHIKTSEILFAGSNDTGYNDTIGNHNAGHLRDHLRQQALQYACQAASLARDFRETYGLKIITPFITHTMGLASFIFIMDLEHKSHQEGSPDTVDDNREHADTPIASLEMAFGECFRCMLSAGMQHMYPRAVVRMMYHAATALKFTLPENAREMLQIVNENSWRPLYTTDESSRVDEFLQRGGGNPIGGKEEHPLEMEDLLKKWEELGLQDKCNLLSGEDEATAEQGQGRGRGASSVSGSGSTP
ncbi:hypothetical protein DOTSEDRAFT_70844 [Dothistroma septosporum NZE10]|uniref:Zn(2)-C6 fungal-type domain-containing protein n=1 Tax=Dothistroma septosporum (strain NZE10 / CBS 128990) TaxID=675120 RepID=N1PNF0_DOTSN|nr:hypothetical protein DOTSEDRAFT_70844 [Dothistroma septosporum NZE10]